MSNWKTVLSDWSGYALTLVLGFVSVPSASVLIENIYNYIAASISAGASPIGAPPAWLLLALSVIGSLLGHALGISHVQVKKALRLKGLIKMLALFAFFAMVGTASAYEWTIPTNAVKSTKIKTESMIPSGLDKNMVVGIPTAALAVGTVSTSYGLSVAYSALWCHVKGDADGTTSTLTSKFGVGAAAYGDFGDWLKSNFQTDPKLKVGVGVILPQMCGITPGVQLVWDVKNGSRTTVVTINVPMNLLNSVIVKLF